jgi:hypothetical protein
MSKRLKKSTTAEWVKSSSYSLVNERDIAIFRMGKEQGAEEYKQQIETLLNENLSKSYNDTTKVLEKLREDNISVISARLKVKAINSLNIILSIKESELLNSKIDKIYNFIYDLEEVTNTENYTVDFSIIKANESFSDKRVESDGYIYKHRLLLNEETARTA